MSRGRNAYILVVIWTWIQNQEYLEGSRGGVPVPEDLKKFEAFQGLFIQ